MSRRDTAALRPVPVTRRFERSFKADPGQVRIARLAVAGFLAGCPAGDDVLLIVSELATNSVQHSRSRYSGQFAVRAEIRDDEYVWIEVEDAGGPWRMQPGRDDERGKGLQIVDALSGEWGVDDTGPAGAEGRVVWARVEL